MRPQTVQIHLPFGDPRGVRQAEIITCTVRVFEIPRTEIARFTSIPGSGQPGLYLLFGTAQAGKPACRIGTSGHLGEHLIEHDRGEAFWTRAVVAVSVTGTWTKAHLAYLEQLAILGSRQAGQYACDNIKASRPSSAPAWLEADCQEFFATIEVLVSTLGYPVFKEHRRASIPDSPSECSDSSGSLQ